MCTMFTCVLMKQDLRLMGGYCPPVNGGLMDLADCGCPRLTVLKSVRMVAEREREMSAVASLICLRRLGVAPDSHSTLARFYGRS